MSYAAPVLLYLCIVGVRREGGKTFSTFIVLLNKPCVDIDCGFSLRKAFIEHTTRDFIEWFIENQAFLRTYALAPPRPPPPPSPLSKLSLFLSLPVCRRSSLLTERGGGVGEELNFLLEDWRIRIRNYYYESESDSGSPKNYRSYNSGSGQNRHWWRSV